MLQQRVPFPHGISVLASLAALLLAACGPSSPGLDAGPSAPDAGPTVLDAGPSIDAGPLGEGWGELDIYLDEGLARGAMQGYAIQVFAADDTLLYQREGGVCATRFCPDGSPAFTVDLLTSIASSTKWVSSTTVLATLDAAVARGDVASLEAALDTPIPTWLTCAGGVPAPYDAATLRQLLSFTSGVMADHDCVGRASYGGEAQTLMSCACTILADSASALQTDPTAGTVADNGHPPGTTYKYGSAHLTIAGAIAEQIDGRPWATIYEERVQRPAGLAMSYRRRANPSLAASVQASVADYARFVRAVFHDARDGAGLILSREAAEEQRRAQFDMDTTAIRNSPQPGMAYGLNTWRTCTPHPTRAQIRSETPPIADPLCGELFQSGHGGKGGYNPFIDVGSDAYAVFAMREDSAGGGADYTDTAVLSCGVRSLVHLLLRER